MSKISKMIIPRNQHDNARKENGLDISLKNAKNPIEAIEEIIEIGKGRELGRRENGIDHYEHLKHQLNDHGISKDKIPDYTNKSFIEIFNELSSEERGHLIKKYWNGQAR